MQHDENANTRKVLEMITVAHDYCLFMEKSDDYPLPEILSYLQKVLPLLYLKGSLLPVIEPDQEEFAERFVTEEEWENLFLILSKKFGKMDDFDVIPLETLKPEGFERLRLSECLADIYQDMKDFVLLYQKNTQAARENAVYQCTELFQKRWGLIITQCLTPIHRLNAAGLPSHEPESDSFL